MTLMSSQDYKKKKILFCASTVSHIINFHTPYLKEFCDLGYEVHVAVDRYEKIDWAHKTIALPFTKSLFSLRNIYSIVKLRRLLKTGGYEKISSNTTLAGIIVRFACLFLKKRPRIYHIVHGYHFSLNDGLKKLLYLIPEKIASSVSDVVMVMNAEDYNIAEKYHLYKSKLYCINGIGIDEKRFVHTNDTIKLNNRLQMGLPRESFIFAYAAEFSKRKNQQLLIRAFAECGFANSLLLLAGDGKLISKCKQLAIKLGVERQVVFLGHINNVPELYAACDVVVSSSRSEGLPFNIIEALGCGVPVIASDIKGHRDLIRDSVNGMLFENGNKESLIDCMKKMYDGYTDELKDKLVDKDISKYALNNVKPHIMEIYIRDSGL